MQNCKLVTIHKNTTTGNVITGVRRCFNCYSLAPEPCWLSKQAMRNRVANFRTGSYEPVPTSNH